MRWRYWYGVVNLSPSLYIYQGRILSAFTRISQEPFPFSLHFIHPSDARCWIESNTIVRPAILLKLNKMGLVVDTELEIIGT